MAWRWLYFSRSATAEAVVFHLCALVQENIGMRGLIGRIVVALALVVGWSGSARADQLCDPAFEDCRAILINLIRAEPVGIDVAFWFMEDARYSAELVKKAQQGVRIRVLVDTRANAQHPVNGEVIAQLAAAGIPIRKKTGGSILHWKMMLFAGQQIVEFSGANYSPDALVPAAPYSNYIDEAIYFTDEPALVQSFMRRFDDRWIDTEVFTEHANSSGAPTRRYPQYAVAPELNFPPSQNYRTRSVARYKAESQAIDVIMYRITDGAQADAIIAAVQRGVRVRLITEQAQYRDPTRLWHSWNVDRLYMAGVQIRIRAHQGLSHQKLVIFRGQGMAIFGSSNWTTPSAASQEEHNIFSTKSVVVQWFQNQFERKWNNLTGIAETQPFTPLPPDKPIFNSPAVGATRVSIDAPLRFSFGAFAHLYDIYLGTTPDPPLFKADVPLGPAPGSTRLTFEPETPLAVSTVYYWRVVAKTMAQQVRVGPVWSFSTSATPPPPPPAPSPAPSPDPAPAAPPPPARPPQPLMNIDLPANGMALRQPFTIAGWAIDAASTTGNGVDVVHVYAYPATGAKPILLGVVPVVGARPDVGGFFGARFASSGYGLVARGLAPGAYTIVVYAHSTVAGTFALARTVNVTVQPSAMVVIDLPANNAAVDGGFVVAGWAADFGAATGGGIDLVHVYAYPIGRPGAPIFLGAARANVSRPDVARYGGSQFGTAGYNMTTRDLPAGLYQIVVYGRSLVTGTFAAAATALVTTR